MNNRIATLSLIVICLLLAGCSDQEFFIVKNNKGKSRIVIPSDPTNVERKAATVLQDYIQQISGAKLNIVNDNKREKNNEILIGKVNRTLLDSIDFSKLGEDGFVIMTKQKQLVIAGGTEKGTLYGVYSFLEKYLNCRKYSSKVTIVPEQETIILGDINDLLVPAYKFREVYYSDVYDPNFREWHGLDSHGELKTNSDWGLWCHTYFSLVSPEEYGESHPEYFSMIDGKRTLDNSDLCLSNPEVFDIAYKNLEKLIEEKPGMTYWSVSQMDNDRHCRCPKCKEAHKKAGGPMGTILPFTNKMAKKFPNKVISTLSYWYSTKPPKDIVPEKNVNIMLCNIGSPRHIPFEQGDSVFCNHLEGWNELTSNILLWDYVIQFSHLIAPFPNLRTLQANLQYLNKNGVIAMFEQGNREIGGEFCELRAYLLAKLMWNPNLDIDVLMDDFLKGYYGTAGKDIRKYIDLIHDEMEKAGAKLNIFGRPSDAMNTFLTEELITEYTKIFDKAEAEVANDPEILFRVETARMALDYAILDIAMKQKTGERGALFTDTNGKIKPKPDIVKTLEEVIAICNKKGVTRVHEWNTTPDEYLLKYKKFLEDNSTL